ncbi:ABC transporter ATP-binding protein [Brucella pituitosa]|uniref:ABC transporter ATP-binding protein n=2 Tax=Brucella pituitosa TaxID=571256 RepID=A0A643EVH9_9HYPH|nr:ABC transporter ATP-binding protein [Brucella pituitosa]KAB0568284.1 ABC transporter ATP-binding protein [Brucella pituitosa]MCK4206435.1 ABC transporter ATP-binding protein [Brucella pituitosa]PJO49972.1 ABC transporter ATP-binding protein [Brucella pituitosa]PRA84626.1 ABC transporter ATP-binding protein [Ochrobactrum sp. MYb29]
MQSTVSATDNSTSVDAILSVRNLSIGLPRGMDRQFAVRNVSFQLRAGEILCIIGESGSGKSVTANTIMGLLPSTMQISGGEIDFKGSDLLNMPERQRRLLRGKSVSIIFQDPLSSLNPLMTIRDQIEEVLVAHDYGDAAKRKAKIVELLTEVGLPEPEVIQHQYPFRLSGGQRQRVMIAMALALDPDVLIADEPTTALDVTTQAQILDLIRKIQKRKGMSVMFITHDFGVVSEIADSVIVMEKGNLVEQGSAADVLVNPKHPYTQRLIAAIPHMREDDRTAAEQSDIILEASKLTKTYHVGSGMFGRKRVVPALQEVSFTLKRGKTLGVVGESGSGKSSLGRVLMKLTDVDSGNIFFESKDIAPLSEAEFRPLRPRIQMVFQDPFASLNPRHTIGMSLTVGPITHGQEPKEVRKRALETLELVGLDRGAMERFPHEFSGGQRQRVGIARALMLAPEILIADEAVSALDVSIQAQILELLQKVQKDRDLAIIFITHDLRVASQICDDVLVMHRGTVVESGPPSRIFGNPANAYTRSLVAAIPGLH